MKKVIKIFLFLFVFFIININTFAVGVSKDEISSNIETNHYNLDVGDYLCVYKTPNENSYVAVKFFKKLTNDRYEIMVYHNDDYLFNVYDESIRPLPDDLIYNNSSFYLKTTPNCSDYVFYYSGNDQYYTIYSKSILEEEYGSFSPEPGDMLFDDELSLLNIEDDNPIITKNPANDAFIMINGDIYYYVPDANGGYFQGNGVTACYVETDPNNEFSYRRGQLPSDISELNSAEMVVQIDTTGVCGSAGHMILKKTAANQGNGSSLIAGEDITLLDKYVVYGNSEDYILIYIVDSNIMLYSYGRIVIEVENMSKYNQIFLSQNEKYYPKYLIYSDNAYYFSEYKTLQDDAIAYNYTANIKFHSNLANHKYASTDKVYTSLSKLFKTENGAEITLETCQDLFNPEFIEFLNNNIFKIIYIGVPIILILLTSFDFAKVVFVDDKEGIQKAGKRFGKRVVVAILIFLVPTIIIFISNIMGADQIDTCVQYFNDMSETY